MIRRVLFIIICVQWIKGYSQRIVVVDSIEKSPLSFVAIKYEGGGMYTNEIGELNLNEVKGEHLKLSLLGYKTKEIAKGQVNDSIFLSSNPTSLDEVTVVKRLEKEIRYKKPKKTNFFGSAILTSKMGICLILIPESPMVDSKVDHITFYFKRELGMQSEKKEALENVDAFIRINIHDVVNEQPANQIFASEPIKISALKKDEIVLDLNDRLITIPKEGISISIEMLGYYDKQFNELDNEGYVRPMLTPQKYKHFKAITYKHFPFRATNQFVLMSDFLNTFKVASKYSDRTLAIGMTLSH